MTNPRNVILSGAWRAFAPSGVEGPAFASHQEEDNRKVRLGILLSGRGSNFLAIAESIRAGRLPGAEIAIVISNVADARD